MIASLLSSGISVHLEGRDRNLLILARLAGQVGMGHCVALYRFLTDLHRHVVHIRSPL